MNLSENEKESGGIYYEDKILKLSQVERLVVQVLRSVAIIFSLIASFVLILSDLFILRVVGVMFFAYLAFELGRLVYLANDDRRFKGGNLATYIKPRARGVIISAYNRSTTLTGSIYIHILKELAEREFIQKILKDLGVRPGEFMSRVEKHLSEEKGLRETGSWKRARINELVKGAFILQQPDKHPVGEVDLFRAVINIDSERVQRIVGLFEISRDELDSVLRSYRLIK